MSAVTKQSSLDLASRLAKVATLDPSARCLQVDGRWYTWADMATASAALQKILQQNGIARDALPIAVVMRNSASTVAAVFSIVTHRQAVITLSDLMPNERLAESITRLPVAVIIAQPVDWTPALTAAAGQCGALGLSVSPEEPGQYTVTAPLRLSSDEVAGRARPGVALEMLTSGTTGPPKRIPLSYESLEIGIAGASHYTSEGRDRLRLHKGVAVVAMPLLHMGGVWTTLFNYANGRPVAMMPRFDVGGWVDLIREHRPLVANVPPASLQMLLDRHTPAEDLASLKAVTVGTAPLSPELAERFEDEYGIAVLAVYGATEYAGGVAGWSLADRLRYAKQKRGSVGRAHADVELRAVDPASGEPVAAGVTGLLELKAPQIRSTAADGWLRTNDLASVDEDGFLWIRGRADDAIIRGGFKISAGQVAEVLRQHPDVGDAAVVGVPDERLGEVPMAAVEPSGGPGTVLDEAMLREWCRERLTAYQMPVRIISVDALPRGAVLKVNAQAVRELINDHIRSE